MGFHFGAEKARQSELANGVADLAWGEVTYDAGSDSTGLLNEKRSLGFELVPVPIRFA